MCIYWRRRKTRMENKIKLTISGNEYYITTDESESYTTASAEEIETKIENMLENSAYLSTTMAAVLTALQYCDRCHKAETNNSFVADKMTSFSDANTRARAEIVRAYREIEKLNKENKQLREKLNND